MERRTLEVLAWKFIQTELALRTRSPLGASRAEHHQPLSSSNAAELMRLQTSEAQKLLQCSLLHSYLADTADPAPFFKLAFQEGVLRPEEIFLCGHFMTSVSLIQKELSVQKLKAPQLEKMFHGAPSEPPLCAIIYRSVTSSGEILDSASDLLARLRSERIHKRADLENTLTTKVKEWHRQGFLQDQYFDVRDGRYVVPVKAESQSKLSGTLLGKSNTGQSVFVEPTELMISNNALKEVDLAIRAEEYRILRNLSSTIASLAPNYEEWIQPMAELDLVFAAALFANEYKLTKPTVGANLDLKQVFHPELLHSLKQKGLEGPVKNSFALENPKQCLLISGPNAGGKTVLLKATATAALMASSGLFVPAAEHSEVPHYEAVYSLIGDEQNLNLGLSSFSAQISDMKTLLERKSSGSCLIVVDEILSSTNPEEAAALSQALIEEFLERGHHLVITTHFTDLSARLARNEKILIAAMEFQSSGDQGGLGRATYRLRLGEVGSSHALEVAERFGISAKLISRARGLMSQLKIDYQKAIDDLKNREKILSDEYEKATEELRLHKIEIERNYKTKLEEKIESFTATVKKLVDETIERLSTKKVHIVRTPTSMKEEADALMHQVKDEQFKAFEMEKPQVEVPLVGSKVRISSLPGQIGEILEIKAGAIPSAILQVGKFKMQKPLHELKVTAAQKKPAMRYIDLPTRAIELELDVRGKRFEEALSEMGKFLDHGFRSGAISVTIITGHGTGALKQGLKDLIKRLPYVKSTRSERTHDDGAMVIEFEH